MDQEVLVRGQCDGGQKLVEQLAANGFPMHNAFWTKTDEDDKWYLYIVTPLVENPGPLDAYRRIRAAIRACQWDRPEDEIDPGSVKVLEPTHSLAKGVADVGQRYPGPLNTWYRITWVGDVAVSGMYIYAVPRTAPQPAGS